MRILKLAAALGLAFLLSGCAQPPENEFAIYLTKNPAPATATPANVELAGDPIIAAADIISYDRATHEMTVAPAAIERVKNLAVPTSGRAFAVCLGKEIIYTGAFWTPISSQSYDGITIMKPFGNETTLQLEPGYPTAQFAKGSDPRDNSRILDSLQKAGKLK